jgi:hypothetical protein
VSVRRLTRTKLFLRAPCAVDPGAKGLGRKVQVVGEAKVLLCPVWSRQRKPRARGLLGLMAGWRLSLLGGMSPEMPILCLERKMRCEEAKREGER